jgi:5-methylcytosine-specific restriction endonuclease McrA
VAKRGDPRLNRAYRYKFRNTVLSRDNFVCFYCGADADQVDHIIPISKAPELVMSFDNAVACCKRCNVQKGNKSQGVFLASKATPPVFFKTSLSKTVQIVPDSPFNKPETLNFDAE